MDPQTVEEWAAIGLIALCARELAFRRAAQAEYVPEHSPPMTKAIAAYRRNEGSNT